MALGHYGYEVCISCLLPHVLLEKQVLCLCPEMVGIRNVTYTFQMYVKATCLTTLLLVGKVIVHFGGRARLLIFLHLVKSVSLIPMGASPLPPPDGFPDADRRLGRPLCWVYPGSLALTEGGKQSGDITQEGVSC